MAKSFIARSGKGSKIMRSLLALTFVGLLALPAVAGVGDPQTKTDHPWRPGELSCSTFERLFQTQSDLYKRVTGRDTDNEEDKALASWYWRNINYYHCELVGENIGSSKGDRLNREYWGGLFGYGFGLCFDTHHQYGGEIWALLGPNRSRTMGVDGHTSFEVLLKGGPYKEGTWALLDHDIATVVFLEDNSRMAGLLEISKDMSLLKKGSRARGWLPSSLHPGDAQGVYGTVKWAGYTTGYAGVPPIVNLRAGETLRRYAVPGLEDGRTYLYWGVNKNAGGIPGPDRDLTWVSQPEGMYKATKSCPGKTARYGNAVYTYRPDFKKGGYKEGVVSEDDKQVTFEWYSPYVIGAAAQAAVAKEKTGILKPGSTGGLVINGKMTCPVEVSVDQGSNWVKVAETKDGMDLTDTVKGYHQYLLRFGAGAKELADAGIVITTGCQCNSTVVPHVKAGENKVSYESSGLGYVAAGPTRDEAAAHVVAGAMGSPAVTLQLAAPRGAQVVGVYGSAHVGCGGPPRESNYNIEYSVDGGQMWMPILKDYQVKQIPPEPGDWWSQAFLQGEAKVDKVAKPVLVRFSNTGKRSFMRVEAELTYQVPNSSGVKVTYAWKEAGAVKTDVHTVAKGKAKDAWTFTAGTAPETFYVEYAAE
jgi:hypothetical protein